MKATTMNTTPAKNSMTITSALIAPCGMNCRLCHAYVRDKNVCPGCRGDDSIKSKSCVSCKIKNCEKITRDGIEYCFGCDNFPCAVLNHLDKRYRTKYAMSMIDNLKNIKEFGINEFIDREEERWACPQCGGILCVHKESCLSCGHKWR